MGRSSKRGRPSSPAEILARNALQRGQKSVQDRTVRRTPTLWGFGEGLELSPANEDLVVTRDPQRREKLLRARRSDAFSLVSMSPDQQIAADRYVREWMVRARVQLVDDEIRPVASSSPGLAPGQHISQLMIDAGRRIEALHRLVGGSSARLLEGLVEPLAMRGEIRVWRVVVQRATGETERHAQAAAVRMACQNLHEAWPVVDDAEKARREDRADRADRARLADEQADRLRGVSPYAGGGMAG